MSGPRVAMVLAAGLGTRMRPLTNDRPKALVEVAGRPLVDHVLDRLAASGVERAVVNVHAFADLLESHLKTRRTAPEIVIADERPQALETGGGLKHALPLLDADPVWVANIDTVWLENGARALDAVARAWDPARMDACLLLAPTKASIGFHDSGDFFLEPDGRLRFKVEGETGPFVYVGAHITRTSIVEGGPEGPFSLTPIWRRLADEGRLYGVSPPGLWMHVGDPAARERAQARLAEEAAAT